VKTAGTSVESYFEPYCMPEGVWHFSDGRDEYVSETGIIGCRTKDVSGYKWFNHMPASLVQEQLGQKLWEKY